MKFSKSCVCGALGFALLAISPLSASAQRPGSETNFASLFSRSCTQVGKRSSYALNEQHVEDVAVGRRFETSIARVHPGSNTEPFVLVCNINEQGSRAPFGTLRFEFAHEDSSNDVSNISFYLDGNRVGAYTVREGDKKSVLIDVSQAQDLAIEFSGDKYLYIFDATLEPLN